MAIHKLQADSLVLYKIGPARVISVSEKIEIELKSGKRKRVRDKDITLLHPGPLRDLAKLDGISGDVGEAWELAVGEVMPLSDLAELIFDEFTPASAWVTWEYLADGLYFEGEVSAIEGRSETAVANDLAERQRAAREEALYAEFLERVRSGQLQDTDRSKLSEVERVALGRSVTSRILDKLEVPVNSESAHRFLLSCGYWPPNFNPWPLRQGADLTSIELALPVLPDETRRDLTHLAAFAIDDEGNEDPDDAISIDGDRLWVHVADVAALVRPDSHLDIAARERGTNLYLPDGVLTMLPAAVTPVLGMGLTEFSPALSIGFRWTEEGLQDIEITPSTVRVTRLSYDRANTQLESAEFAPIVAVTEAYQQARMSRGAANIDLPEVNLKVVDGVVQIRPFTRLRARQMVTDAMVMAGEAVARFAHQHAIPIPFASQPAPEELRQPKAMSESYAYRRLFKPSRISLEPGSHFGLGVEFYTRVTSPLRRYQDLLTHQQVRNHLTGKEILSAQQVSERMGISGEAGLIIRRSERMSNLHWKLIYLRDNPDWCGEAVVVELDPRRATLMIPALAMETKIRFKSPLEMDQVLQLKVREVDIPGRTAQFSV